jgi:hypothetical protein
VADHEAFEDVAQRAAAVLHELRPDGLCDACLAFALETDLEAARRIVRRLVRTTTSYARKSQECFACRRLLEVTCRMEIDPLP